MSNRLIPCLLLRSEGLYKTIQFDNPKYVGDPINAVRVFNDKEVDELIILDIEASKQGRPIAFEMVGDIASEAFMPLCYGGGVRTMTDFERLFAMGVEKVAVNTSAVESPDLVAQAAETFGSQSVVVSIDARRGRLRGLSACIRSGTIDAGLSPRELAITAADLGAGEILLTSIDRDGTGKGYDLALIKDVADVVGIPVIALGGAGNLDHCVEALRNGASGVAAGSMFVFHGSRRAVLISYPSAEARAHLI